MLRESARAVLPGSMPPVGEDQDGSGSATDSKKRSQSSPGDSSPGGSDATDKPLPDEPPMRKRWRWSRDVSEFEELEQIGEGAYGDVLMGRDKVSNEIVALKKVKMDQEKEGFPTTSIRELKMLRSLRHENIVRLKEIVTGQNGSGSKAMKDRHEIYMVFEYVDNDLGGLLDTPSVEFTEAHVKAYVKQLLQGLWYCHERQVLHRDIKGSNLLIDAHGCLKIADMGLARTYCDNLRRYTNRVITLWYRPPELLLGAERYGPEVDIWSVGCLVIEMLCRGKRSAAFPGCDEADQIDKIFKVCGLPDNAGYPEWRNLPLAKSVKVEQYHEGPDRLKETFPELSDLALDLVRNLIHYRPSERLTAHKALSHPWFWTRPYPTPRDKLPRYSATHEYQAKQRREMARKKKNQEGR